MLCKQNQSGYILPPNLWMFLQILGQFGCCFLLHSNLHACSIAPLHKWIHESLHRKTVVYNWLDGSILYATYILYLSWDIHSTLLSTLQITNFSVSSHQNVLYSSVAIMNMTCLSQMHHTAHFGDLSHLRQRNWWFGWHLHQKIGD